MTRILYLLLFMSSFSNLAWSSPRKLYLSVGINTYESNYWRRLKFAEKDAHDIAKALNEKFQGGEVLTASQQPHRAVKKADIQFELEKLARENRFEDDVILVYLSGHGTVGRDSSGRIEKYLVSSDSRPEDLNRTALSHSELFKWFNGLKSRRKVLILDSCYSGGGKSRLTEKILQQLAQTKAPFFKEPEPDVSEGMVVLAASAWSEEADESEALQNGLYTHFLIEGFDRDYNGDGAVSITEAHQFATQRVEEFSEGRQHPTARMDMVGQDPIILRGSRSGGSPILFSYEWLTRKMNVEINGKRMGNLSRGALLVPQGEHRLTLRGEKGEVLVNRHVTFEAGQEYPLSQFTYEDFQWSARVGAWFGRASSPSIREKSLAGTLQGWQLELEKEEALGSFAVQARALYLHGSESIRSGEQLVPQRLRGARFALSIGKQKIFAPSADKAARAYLKGNVGPAFLYLSRKLEDESFMRPQQTLTTPGLLSSIELGIESRAARLQVGVRGSIEAYDNNAPWGPSLQVLGSAEFVLGAIW